MTKSNGVDPSKICIKKTTNQADIVNSSASIITVVRDPKNPLGKQFQRNPNGTIDKQSAVYLSVGIAVMTGQMSLLVKCRGN